MQAAQMSSHQMKDFHTMAKEERKASYTKTTGANTLSKKAHDSKVDPTTKKLIFSFKKDSNKQKVTPPNV